MPQIRCGSLRFGSVPVPRPKLVGPLRLSRSRSLSHRLACLAPRLVVASSRIHSRDGFINLFAQLGLLFVRFGLRILSVFLGPRRDNNDLHWKCHSPHGSLCSTERITQLVVADGVGDLIAAPSAQCAFSGQEED